MRAALSHLWSRHRLLSLAFLLAVLVTLGFAIRLGTSMSYWSDPAHRDQPIAGWMTPRYVAMSWQVPPEVIRDALDLETPSGAGRISLDRLADETGVPVETLVQTLEAAIAAHRQGRDD